MMDLYLIFQFIKGSYHGNQIMLQKCFQRRLIPLAFVALVLEIELQYYDLAVRINSGDDGATSSKNLVNFCLVNLEMTGLICERQVRHIQKTGVFCRISPDILEAFSQCFHYMKALYVQMMDLYLIFQFIKGHCHGNQKCCHNGGKLILRAFFARLPDGSTVLVRYYLLGGDTPVPSGLYARLCHAFLVSFFFISGSTGLIFTIFSPNGRYVCECCQSTTRFQTLLCQMNAFLPTFCH